MKINQPLDVVQLFPVRKSGKQKETFRQAVTEYLEGLGYGVSVEKGSFRSHNVVVGNPEKAKYLITAHYDTCARMIVPNLVTPCNAFYFLLYQMVIAVLMMVLPLLPAIGIGFLVKSVMIGYAAWMILLWIGIVMIMIGPANPSNVNDNTSGVVSVLELAKSMPEGLRNEVCFVLFDLEEAGLIGSASYHKKHKKASDSQLVLNLDCVGEGDYIYLFPTAKLKKNQAMLNQLDSLCGPVGKKSITLRRKGFSVYPSDQRNFRYGVGICALKKNWAGLYLAKIHTPKDIILDETNVNILRAAIISMMSGTAVHKERMSL